MIFHMTQFKPIGLVLAACALGAGGYGLYTLGVQRGAERVALPAISPGVVAGAPAGVAAPSALPQSIAQGEAATRRHMAQGIKAGDLDAATGRRVLYYHDPMVPGNRFDAPAKSPFMDMMLVPVYAQGASGADDGASGSDGAQQHITVSSRMQNSLGVRTARVAEGVLAGQLTAVGNITFNERDQGVVQTRAAGYIERLWVRAPFDPVAQGQALADLYVPEWIAVQEEFLAVQRMRGADPAATADAARQRLRLAGMSEEHIALVERSGKAQPRITLTAPMGGVVVELLAREGMAVVPGATLFRINGVERVWAEAHVPQSQAAGIGPGASVHITSDAAPGTPLRGTVQALLPEVNSASSTRRVRVELANPGRTLVPGMVVRMQFTDKRAPLHTSLMIPSEAVIQTGQRAVVILAEDNGQFRPIEVETGLESGEQTQIRRGLRAGQRVVVSAQFLLDSEASLKGVQARMLGGSQP
jgi:membrane fusion protein, copper/silver efflux system